MLVARNVTKSYRQANFAVPVLHGVDLQVNVGEFIAIVGQSGSGKSTLLHLLSTLDAPDGGQIEYLGQRIDNISARVKEALRNDQFGMIFQFYHLLPELTTLENVLLPLMIKRSSWAYARIRKKQAALAADLLQRVGLGHRLQHKPRELSGGEMQRVAIARALIAQPRLLFADEPTGNLDQTTGREIMQLLRSLNQDRQLTIVMVTHDEAIAAQAHRVLRLVDGRAAARSD